MKNIFYVVVMTTILACTNKESYNSNLADWNGKQTPVGRSLTTDEIAQLKKEENALFSMSPIPLNKLEFNEWSNNISFGQIDKMYREFIKKNILPACRKETASKKLFKMIPYSSRIQNTLYISQTRTLYSDMTCILTDL